MSAIARSNFTSSTLPSGCLLALNLAHDIIVGKRSVAGARVLRARRQDGKGTKGDYLYITARCVLIVDRDGKVAYTQLVPEVGQEPNYDEVIAKARELAA